MNFELKVLDVPIETFMLIGKINNESLIKNLKKNIKENIDDNLSYKTNVKAKFTGFNYLIKNNYFHEFLKLIDSYIKIISKQNFIIKEAWGNVYKKSEEAISHRHFGTTSFCGILYLTDGGPGTFFDEYNVIVTEEIGKFILFHPMLLHGVKKIENDIERITVAFNMDEVKVWDNSNNIVL